MHQRTGETRDDYLGRQRAYNQKRKEQPGFVEKNRERALVWQQEHRGERTVYLRDYKRRKNRASREARLEALPFNRAADVELAYAAGIIDGEGCISIRRSYATKGGFHLSIVVSMTSATTIDWLLEHLGGRSCESSKLSPTGRRLYQWVMPGMGAHLFLVKCLPYLVTKRDEASLAIRFYGEDLQHDGTAKPDAEINRRLALKDALSRLKRPRQIDSSCLA